MRSACEQPPLLIDVGISLQAGAVHQLHVDILHIHIIPSYLAVTDSGRKQVPLNTATELG